MSDASLQPTSRSSLWGEPAFQVVCGLALVMAGVWFSHAWGRWAHFQFTTFDLAFYVQCLWAMLHGDLTAHSSLLEMPMLGNHADLIVLPLVPLYALIPHPLTPVAVQVALCAALAPLGYAVARRLELSCWASAALAATLALTPALSFAASFEFHPETLTGFFILLIYYAELRGKRGLFWVAVLATLACKENMALLLAAWAIVRAALLLWEKRRELRAALVNPAITQQALLLLACIAWFVGYEKLVRPALNPSKVEYGSLYDHLGGSMGSVILSLFTQPAALFTALAESLQGNLLWATLLPVAFLPLLRPQWIIIAGPILAQHLLSNRSSEWGITHHYAVPLIPLWFIGAAEAVAWLRTRPYPQLQRWVPASCVLLSLLTLVLTKFPQQVIHLAQTTDPMGRLSVAERREFLAQIPQGAPVIAGPPYLSHLADRRKLYSLQLISKGSLTLSTAPYTPPRDAEHLLLDHQDMSIFPLIAGFFHGPLEYPDGTRIPASDILIHQVLRDGDWVTTRSVNEVTLYRRLAAGERAPAGRFMPPEARSAQPVNIGGGNILHFAQLRQKSLQPGEKLDLGLIWEFPEERQMIPWMVLKLESADRPPGSGGPTITRGLVLPQGVNNGQLWRETWTVDLNVWPRVPRAYRLSLVFQDQTAVVALARQAQQEGGRPDLRRAILAEVPLGEIVVQ